MNTKVSYIGGFLKKFGIYLSELSEMRPKLLIRKGKEG